jgi:hypothetical protein
VSFCCSQTQVKNLWFRSSLCVREFWW